MKNFKGAEKVLCEQCGKHIANIVDGDFVEINKWGMTDDERELCIDCITPLIDEELLLEAAQCIWEAVLEELGSKNSKATKIRERIGTSVLRYFLRQKELLEACNKGWDILEKNGKNVEMLPYDWEYVPWFVRNCLDWDMDLYVTLKSDWEDIINNI